MLDQNIKTNEDIVNASLVSLLTNICLTVIHIFLSALQSRDEKLCTMDSCSYVSFQKERSLSRFSHNCSMAWCLTSRSSWKSMPTPNRWHQNRMAKNAGARLLFGLRYKIKNKYAWIFLIKRMMIRDRVMKGKAVRTWKNSKHIY